MKRKNWQSALKVDFSKSSTLKSALLAELMQRPDAPPDVKQDLPIKKTIKQPIYVLICALIAAILLSGAVIAAMRTFSLGPYATSIQAVSDPQLGNR